jgi:hypothetical protein
MPISTWSSAADSRSAVACASSPRRSVDPFLPQQAGDQRGAAGGRRQQQHARQVRHVVAGRGAVVEEEQRGDATAMTALAMPETMPLTEAASATMQTNSGAGLGMERHAGRRGRRAPPSLS